jgi:hypothetical protein
MSQGEPASPAKATAALPPVALMIFLWNVGDADRLLELVRGKAGRMTIGFAGT